MMSIKIVAAAHSVTQARSSFFFLVYMITVNLRVHMYSAPWASSDDPKHLVGLGMLADQVSGNVNTEWLQLL